MITVNYPFKYKKVYQNKKKFRISFFTDFPLKTKNF